MKKRILKAVCVLLSAAAVVLSFPYAALAAPTFDQILNAAVYIIISNEGQYSTVLKNDNGAVSLGKLGWHATNALNLLKQIVSLNPSQAVSILGTELYDEIVTSSSWEGRILNDNEASRLAVFLATSESMSVQDESARNYVINYLNHGMSLGITDPAALVFFADYENQNGHTGAENFFRRVISSYGVANLSTLYDCSNKNYRRTKTYNFCASLNWESFNGGNNNPNPSYDHIPPVISDVTVTDLTSEGFTVSCLASDNASVESVYYAIYNLEDGASGTQWYQYAPVDGRTSHTMYIYDFNSRSGDYSVYIYAFDKAGNCSYAGLNVITVPGDGGNALSLAVTSQNGLKDGKITWRARASGGGGDYRYSFELYRDDVKIAERGYNDFSDYTYSITENGVYKVKVTVRDMTTGDEKSAESPEINVFDPIVIDSLKPDKKTLVLGENVSWTASVSGGEGELKYSFTVYKDDSVVESGEYGSSPDFTYRPAESGTYKVSVSVEDERSQAASFMSEEITVTEPFAVSSVGFSRDFAVIGESVECIAEIKGGSGSYSCVFNIELDGETILTSEPVRSGYFIFTPEKAGTYVLTVTATDDDSSVSSLSGGELIVAEDYPEGDANADGKITAADARIALRCSAKLMDATAHINKIADINADGFITASDARAILRISASL